MKRSSLKGAIEAHSGRVDFEQCTPPPNTTTLSLYRISEDICAWLCALYIYVCMGATRRVPAGSERGSTCLSSSLFVVVLFTSMAIEGESEGEAPPQRPPPQRTEGTGGVCGGTLQSKRRRSRATPPNSAARLHDRMACICIDYGQA